MPEVWWNETCCKHFLLWLSHLSATFVCKPGRFGGMAVVWNSCHGNPSPTRSFGFTVPHFCRGGSLRSVASLVSAVIYLRLRPLAPEFLKSQVCRNDSAQLSQPRFYVHFANHFWLCSSVLGQEQLMCDGWTCDWHFHLWSKQFWNISNKGQWKTKVQKSL